MRTTTKEKKMVRPVGRKEHATPPASIKELKNEAKIIQRIETKALKSLDNFPKSQKSASKHLKERDVVWTHKAKSAEDKKVALPLKRMHFKK